MVTKIGKASCKVAILNAKGPLTIVILICL